MANHGGARNFKVLNGDVEPSAAAIGLSRKQIHEARLIRDAERADPGIVARTVADAVESGEEPTRAKVRRAAKLKAKRKRCYASRSWQHRCRAPASRT